jgi:hypothetical protein
MSTFACQLCACGSDRTRSHDPIEECQVESRKRMCTWQVAKGPAGILACRPFLQLSSCWQTCKASSGCRNRTLHSTHLSLRLPATSWFEETSVLTSNSDRALLSSSVVDSSICCKARTQMECHRTSILFSCCLPQRAATWLRSAGLKQLFFLKKSCYCGEHSVGKVKQRSLQPQNF